MNNVSSLFLSAVLALLVAPVAHAQDVTVRHRQAGVMPQALAADVQRLVREAIGVGSGAWNQRQDFTAEQSDRKTHTVTLGVSGALDLSNVVGDIMVKAGSGRDATVEVVRTSRGRSDADAKVGLERVTVEMTTGPERASFSAKYPDERKPPYSVSVAYTVTAPAGTRVTARSVSGDVTVTGLKGELTVSTVSGDATATSVGQVGTINTVSGDLMLTDVASHDSVEVGVMSGDIALKNVTARRLAASTVSGSITASGIQATSADLRSVSGGIGFSGAVAGSGRYDFQSHSGDVTLTLSGGYDVDVTTFSGNIATDAGLGLTSTTGRRQALRGTVDTGGAAVKVTTFSGDVRIGRAGGR